MHPPQKFSAKRQSSTSSGWWRPSPGLIWQWHLTELPVDTSINVDVYDIDIFDNDASVVQAIHDKGRRVIGYFSAGSWENWRPDSNQFPPEVIGRDYEGWPGEKWLDIRQIDQLAPILCARFDLCRQKGFDGVEPDNMEIYTSNTGFPLVYDDQLKFALWLADEAHARGLAIGQKNASDQVAALVDVYDFAIIEDAFYDGWAEQMLPYIQAGKAVFAAEYTDMGVDFESARVWGHQHGFSFILKNRNLNAWRKA
ncbi:MAG: endo alpha-1,4 polygalactosaminidase [Anaerolineales bacterium]|nr:endo alpha-1,4 polygalactosaminidase [Anaerolineales bacterium]